MLVANFSCATILPSRSLSQSTPAGDEKGTVILMQRPLKRLMLFADEHPSLLHCVPKNESRAYFVSFPYVFYRLNYWKVKGHIGYPQDNADSFHLRHGADPSPLVMAFATEEKPSKLYVPSLFNAAIDGSICLGGTIKAQPTLESLYKSVIHNFWSTSFNYDLSGAIRRYSEKDTLHWAIDLRQWEMKTKENPTWTPTAEEMVPSPRTVNDFFQLVE